jgi:CelD/BcsL family acetyltransferase involved in cellulose biosynthesis
MAEITFQRVDDGAGLAERWRALEADSAGGFFRGWTYVGTLLRHMQAPYLLAVRQDGLDVGLGLFNRTAGRLTWRFSLHETGVPAWDRFYVEHNGLLLRQGGEGLLQAALREALRHGSLILSGVDDLHRQAAMTAGTATIRSSQFAPALDLVTLSGTGRPFLETLSANARAQIRRAMRLYGPDLRLQRATGVAEALGYFHKLVALHQAAWRARGQAGAFAGQPILDFHAALIRAGVPRGEVALLRVSAGARDIGYLYNFQHSGRVLSYQSGLSADPDARLKPGLVCHALAIEQARAEGFILYDLLAGVQRYKLTLAPKDGAAVHWAVVHRAGSLAARMETMRQFLQRQTRDRPAG